MICPSCASTRVFRSRAKSARDRALKRLLPVTWYRCHDCGWRRAKIKGGSRVLLLHLLSLIGYAGSIALVIALAAGLTMLALSLLGIALPWQR
jgi:DNA-directed RNA polymerase subunit RPC12/RpoP